MALYAPERVKKLVLLAPMGYTGTMSSVLRIVLVTFFPLKPLQDNTFRWAFGDSAKVHEAFGEWFRTVMDGVVPVQARPQTFSSEQLQSLRVPVLLILGKKDGLGGDPEKAKELAKSISDIQVEILDTGHLPSAEEPDQVNGLIQAFLEKDTTD